MCLCFKGSCSVLRLNGSSLASGAPFQLSASSYLCVCLIMCLSLFIPVCVSFSVFLFKSLYMFLSICGRKGEGGFLSASLCFALKMCVAFLCPCSLSIICLSVYLPTYLSISVAFLCLCSFFYYMSVYLSIHPSVHPSVIYLFLY